METPKPPPGWLRRLSPVEKRIVRHLRNHLRRYGSKSKTYPTSGASKWHEGWDAGFSGAILSISTGVAGRTPKQTRAVKRYCSQIVKRWFKEEKEHRCPSCKRGIDCEGWQVNRECER